MAEELSKMLAMDTYEAYSAGTETKPQINPDAVRIMKQLYQIDMEKDQFSKLISELPEIDIVITMGCNVGCPYLPCKFRDDWGLEDPTGKDDGEFIRVLRGRLSMGFNHFETASFLVDLTRAYFYINYCIMKARIKNG